MKQINFLLFLCLGFIFLFSIQSFAQNSNTDPAIKRMIDKKIQYNQKKKIGFSIQLFFGSESGARKILNEFKMNHTEIYTKLVFERSYWKTQVGRFRTKLEADRLLLTLKKQYPTAIIVPLSK